MADLSVLNVLLHGKPIGTLTRSAGDRVLFAFNQDYIDTANRPTLSLSFKDALGGLITDIKPTQTRLSPFFSNLLPEGALRDYLAKQAGVNPAREFNLIWVLGQDLSGALRVVPARNENSLPPESAHSEERAAVRSQDDTDLLRFSLAGVQLKFSAIKKAPGGLTIPANGEGGSWIVKLPSTRFSKLPENELAMMDLARRVGIDVPETKLVPIKKLSGLPAGVQALGDTAFAIKRFDRLPNGRGVHIEDFAQVFNVYPEQKYARASYRNIAKVLWIETGEAGIAEFVRRLAFNALIGNADMHLKNWSLIYPDGVRARLAPAYDFVSTIAYLPDPNMALSFTDSKAFSSVSRDQFVRFANKAGLPKKLTLNAAEETTERFSHAWRDSEAAIPKQLRKTIDAHLKSIPLWSEIAGGIRVNRSAESGAASRIHGTRRAPVNLRGRK